MKKPVASVSSPAATGGAGTVFELHVDTACLTLLLTGGAPLFANSQAVSRVHLQSGHLGWKTDDLLLESMNSSGRSGKVALQVKRAFSISLEDDDCVSTFQRAFLDFRNTSLFDGNCDRLGLVVSVLSENTIRGLRSMLDCSRAAISAADFKRRLQLPGYVGKTSLKYYEIIRGILDGVEGSAPTDEEAWRFLRVFDVGSLDLSTPGSVVEALLKSLLAATAQAPDAVDAADTWNELFAIASKSSGVAGSFDREALPAHLRERHRLVSIDCATGLSRLVEDTAIVSRDVKTSIAGQVELPRRELLNKLCRLLEEHQVVLVTGAAGSGKSALAKTAFNLIQSGGLGVAFRSESLAGPHINQGLFPHGLTLSRLNAHFALHQRKILWVESVERLLERDDRAAFRDLLNAIKADPSWRLLVTCREYSAQTVRGAFFEDLGIASIEMSVPELKDAELDEVAAALPSLARPLSNQALRKLLKKPFILDKAARMQWSSSAPLPQDEREFRAKVWHEVIRREDEPVGGMPQLRHSVFVEVALRRARALDPFVAGGDLNPDALYRLRRDSLILSPNGDEARLAPAHDVLEDWALLSWLDSVFQETGQNLRQFFERIGTFPALRRAYRKWLRESLDVAPQNADGLVLDVVRDVTVPAYWREDTLVGVLLSKEADAFLQRNTSSLLADGATLLRQVIHLLRVACKIGVPRSAIGISGEGDVFLPSGRAWQAAAEIMEQGLSVFTDGDAQLCVGFLEDWVVLTRWGVRYPRGSRSVAKVALHWLLKFNSWRDHDRKARERLRKVLVNIPLAAEAELTQMVGEELTGQHRNQREDSWLDLIFSHFHGDAVVRDMPELALRVVEQMLDMHRPLSDRVRHDVFHRHELEHAFGFDKRLLTDDFPASAYHGPYLRLLWHHPEKGLDLIVRLLNRSCEAYGDPENLIEHIEPPDSIVIELPDGHRHKQWGNWRLWGLYRGATVGPYALQSALMALERWLLDKAERNDADLPEVLLNLLAKSNNVAVTAVIASVALAYPYKVGDVGYSLLTCPQFFHADIQRMIHDSSGGFYGGMDGLGPDKAFYSKERWESHRLPHRKRRLEQLAVLLQSTPLRDKIWKLIERYQAELPPESEQDDNMRLWRLKLHDLDVRNFVAVGTTDDGGSLYQAATPPAELQRLRDDAKPLHESREAVMGLWMWGVTVFRREQKDNVEPGDWREKLALAQAQLAQPNFNEDEMHLVSGQAGPAYIAAVCVRDHWDDLSESEQAWCANVICNEVVNDADADDYLTVVALNPMGGSRPAAFMLSALFAKKLPVDVRERLLPTLAKAVGHSVEELVRFAVEGIGAYLWSSDRNLALTCLQALVHQAKEKDKFIADQRNVPFELRRQQEAFDAELQQHVRQLVLQRTPCDEAQLIDLDLAHWPGRAVAKDILNVIGKQSGDPLAIQIMATVANTLAEAWKGGRRSRAHRRTYDDEDEGVDIQVEHLFIEHLSQFALSLAPDAALKLCSPIVALAAKCPSKVADFLNGLTLHQDQQPPTMAFWPLWDKIANGFSTSFSTRNQDDSSDDDDDSLGYDSKALLRNLFLNLSWGKETRDWPPLQGEAYRIRALFDQLPPNRAATHYYARFLTSVGAPTLPHALVSISKKLAQSTPQKFFSVGAIWNLEVILTRLIYGGSRHLRGEVELRLHTLQLLDALVVAGSSVAYKLRDDFVTPSAFIVPGLKTNSTQ